MNTFYLRISSITTITVILVIAAGSIVRTTQSGMGCPDWPTCYGLIIPPTAIDQLPQNYQQLYANQGIPAESFDVLKTWIEYVNRLLGALLGLFVLLQTALSIKFRNLHPRQMYASMALLVFTGLQGWLGARVVSSNLAPYKITIHMIVAFIILLIATYASYQSEDNRTKDKHIFRFSLIAMGLMFIQLLMGTQVREEIDLLAKSLNFMQREIWIDNLSMLFPIHRSFSLLITGVISYILYKCRQNEQIWAAIRTQRLFLMGGLGISIFSGIVMTYFSVPAAMQPTHLICASVIIWSLFGIILRSRS